MQMSEKRQVMKLTDKRFWIFEAFVAFVSVGVGYSMLYMEWDTYYTVIFLLTRVRDKDDHINASTNRHKSSGDPQGFA